MKSHAEAMDQAFADHERHHHGGPDPVQPPMACLTDVAARYDTLIAPVSPHPGENHDFQTTCLKCGEPGTLFVAVTAPGEIVRISEAEPVEPKWLHEDPAFKP